MYKTKKEYTVNCLGCENEFQTFGKNLNRGGGKYCSRKCNPLYQPKYGKAEKARKYNLSSKYGLTEKEYDKMLIDQNGGCKICGSRRGNEKHKKLFIDHCHKFDVVRGLLCGRCNSGISLLRDCPEIIKTALFYVLMSGEIIPHELDKTKITAEQLYDYWLEQGIFDVLME